MKTQIALCALCAVALAACDDESTQGHAVLKDASGSVSGNASLTAVLDKNEGISELTVKLTLANSGLTDGDHGVQIYTGMSCDPANGFSAAGVPFNPEGHTHGVPGINSQAGDLGNITLHGGSGALTIKIEGLGLAANDPGSVLNRALVVHMNADDFSADDPSGHAGPVVSCGVTLLDSSSAPANTT
jgi:Cu-Zn family superoxide dismutase